jgi:hypothetical protein
LGLEGAPISDTADPFRHGHGSDALAFRFDRGGQLLTTPAYVAQAQVNNFYTSRCAAYPRQKLADVKSMFGRLRTEQLRRGFIGYSRSKCIIICGSWGAADGSGLCGKARVMLRQFVGCKCKSCLCQAGEEP